MAKLYHSIIVENPTLSGDGYEFEYEIDLNGADDEKKVEFTERYSKVFRENLEQK